LTNHHLYIYVKKKKKSNNNNRMYTRNFHVYAHAMLYMTIFGVIITIKKRYFRESERETLGGQLV
jgi:hypothetical protein